MNLWQRVVEANRPGPPEDSISFRAASTIAILIGIGACWSQGELGLIISLVAIVATVAGNVLSYVTRRRPWAGIKPVLALCAIGGFAWFLMTVTHGSTPGDITTVEGPLAVLFTWVLSTHAFDVPARRDVTYSLAGSTALVAVAAAQSVDLTLGPWVVAWALCGLWGLVAMWQSMASVKGIPWRSLAAAGVAVAVVAVAVVAILPAPRVTTSLVFPSASPNSGPVTAPSGLTDGAGALPAHAAAPRGSTRVGGYLGFAKSLDTGVRSTLSNEVVMRVRASRPGYWVGQTYDRWDGQSWIRSTTTGGIGHPERIVGGSPFAIPTFPDQLAPGAAGATNIQTFYLAQSLPNLVFHADNAQRVYLQAPSVLVSPDGTIVSNATLGAGTIYTVVSQDVSATPEQLQAVDSTVTQPDGSPSISLPALDPALAAHYLQLPHAYPRVATLAAHITAGAGPGTYARVKSIERWMSTHVRYTTDIPALPRGADTVDAFLFGTRRGYCEQISTATVVMLRSLGIPARETVGYIPGSFNPITDLWDVRAKDAHAWVQVWYPGYGWQNVDPTAVVPSANPSPGSVLAHDLKQALNHLPWIPLALVVGSATAAVLLYRRRRRRPPTWAHQVAHDLNAAGVRLGAARRMDEPLTNFAARLALHAPEHAEEITGVALLVERATYGGIEPSADQITTALATAHRLRGLGRRRGSPVPVPQDPDWASASSKEAPAANSGR